MIKDIEHSLQAANLGFSISNDGNLIRLIMPPFTEERRKEYVKQVKKIGEDAKIAVRNVRREGNDLLKKLEKEKAISQDEEKKFISKFNKYLFKISNFIEKFHFNVAVANFYEIGPGRALSGMVKKIDRSVTVHSISDMESIEALVSKN